MVTRCGFALFAAWLALLAGCMPETIRIATPPAGVVATGGITTITLIWQGSEGASSYNVKRSTVSGGPYTSLGSTATLSYTDAAAAAGTTYYYVVSSVAPGGESANSAATSASRVVAPLAPTNLTATAGNRQVTLAWVASAGAASFNVKRATAPGGPYTQVATSTAASFTDTLLTNSTTYYYVVTAVNAAGESANSAQVSATPSLPPPTTFGTWTDVTPAGVDLSSELCSNFGATTVQADPAHPSTLYTLFHCQGVWRSTDYGVTWTGPINTGANGAVMGNCSGGLAIPPNSTASIPTIYAACIRGTGTGFWKSTDGGVSWTRYDVLGTSRQDYFPPVVDPYDANHLLMAGHELDSAVDTIVESVDGGQTWTRVPLASGMLQNGRSPFIFFINTGNATTTRGTWLWIGDASGGAYGTWRTTNRGAAWTLVDRNEHLNFTQIYQPDNNGALFMVGVYSDLGAGILRSPDYGQTWTHVGRDSVQAVVFGTSKNVYAMSDPSIAGDSSFQVATQPGTGTWANPILPSALLQGPAQVAVVNNGTSNIFIGAMWRNGVWRYIEP
jgi:hypothetical protein